MRKGRLFNRPIAIILILVSICCMIVMIMSMLNLPEIPTGHSEIEYQQSSEVGKFGEMMVEMLPTDLAFTVFVPSEKAFERDLGLRANHSLSPEEWDNTYATVSRVLGFSAVPRKIHSDSIPPGEAKSFDSISGFELYVSKDLEGELVVNGVRSKRVDGKKEEVVVHVMDGVIMDAQFEQSVRPDADEQD
uniref:FAS1 domain-containing protein n=1 Tax=Opuntia streptacantha TaxID=393608 RepID=A0A7C8ZU41_OPUST